MPTYLIGSVFLIVIFSSVEINCISYGWIVDFTSVDNHLHSHPNLFILHPPSLPQLRPNIQNLGTQGNLIMWVTPDQSVNKIYRFFLMFFRTPSRKSPLNTSGLSPKMKRTWSMDATPDGTRVMVSRVFLFN